MRTARIGPDLRLSASRLTCVNSGKILAAERLGRQVSPNFAQVKVIFSSWSTCLSNDQLLFNVSSYPLSLHLPLTKNSQLALLSLLSGRVSLLTVNKELFSTWFISTCKIAAAYVKSLTALHRSKSET